jgi:lipoprotein-releasing system permease protein
VRVGDDVTMAWLSDPPRFRKLRVVALYHSGLEEVDARMAFVPLPLGQALRRYEAHYIQVAHVFIQDPQALGPIIERLQEALTVEEEIMPIEYLFSDIFDWLGLIRQNVGLILGIVVGMSFFVATAAFLVLLLVQRSRFQLLRVLGMGKRAIWGLVLGQALVAVGLGVVGGALLSFILLLSQSVWGWAQLDPESYLLEQVPVYWDGTAFALVSLGALGLALIMGWWAAPGAIDSEHRLSEIVS